jgi:GMP synthase (glutamine-hydrolysing)
MTKLKVLVVDGNTLETDRSHVAAGGEATGAHYVNVLQSLRADVECTVAHPARVDGMKLPQGVALSAFDGVAWTGSSLNVYDAIPAVRAQVELARAIFEVGVPQFGSCWGLQVAAVAAGGTVQANPRGRELGIARHIRLTPAGAGHPLYAGKRAPFDAIGVHMDEVTALPPGSTVLAGNDMSVVQAAEIRYKAGTFWGTQYHPEYDFNEISAVILRHGRRLVDAKFFADMPALTRCVTDWRTLQRDPARTDLIWLYGLSADVLEPQRRRHELKQWLNLQVAAMANR